MGRDRKLQFGCFCEIDADMTRSVVESLGMVGSDGTSDCQRNSLTLDYSAEQRHEEALITLFVDGREGVNEWDCSRECNSPCFHETEFLHQKHHDDGFGYVWTIIYTFYSANESLCLWTWWSRRSYRRRRYLRAGILYFPFPSDLSRWCGFGVPRGLGWPQNTFRVLISCSEGPLVRKRWHWQRRECVYAF